MTVASWNGVQLAEIAKCAPPTGVTASAAGATVLIFSGYFGGPLVFALILEASGSFPVGFLVIAATTLLALVLLAGAKAKGPDLAKAPRHPKHSA